MINNASQGSLRTYTAFGLTVASELECPELLAAEGVPNVSISFGDVPENLDGSKHSGVQYQAVPGQLLLNVEGVAKFLIRNGSEILVDRYPGSSDECLRLFLLGSAFGALLHQRGNLVLHGSTVGIGDECIVFLGQSGAGKSTLAAAMRNRGYSCLGDDLCSIEFCDGVPYAIPAYPQAKLWVDSLDQLNLDSATLRRVRPMIEKRAIQFVQNFPGHSLPVRHLFVLTPQRSRDDILLCRVVGPAKMRVIRDYTYRLHFLEGLNQNVAHFKQVAKMASGMNITRIVRPERHFLLNELVDAVERELNL